MECLSSVITVILQYSTNKPILLRVCKTWRDIILRNDRDIIEGSYRKYKTYVNAMSWFSRYNSDTYNNITPVYCDEQGVPSIYDLAIAAIQSNDIPMLKAFMYELQPTTFAWIDLYHLVQGEELVRLFNPYLLTGAKIHPELCVEKVKRCCSTSECLMPLDLYKLCKLHKLHLLADTRCNMVLCSNTIHEDESTYTVLEHLHRYGYIRKDGVLYAMLIDDPELLPGDRIDYGLLPLAITCQSLNMLQVLRNGIGRYGIYVPIYGDSLKFIASNPDLVKALISGDGRWVAHRYYKHCSTIDALMPYIDDEVKKDAYLLLGMFGNIAIIDKHLNIASMCYIFVGYCVSDRPYAPFFHLVEKKGLPVMMLAYYAFSNILHTTIPKNIMLLLHDACKRVKPSLLTCKRFLTMKRRIIHDVEHYTQL